MLFELDGRGSVRDQVVRALRKGITTGRFPFGTRLPPSRDLARELGVSRNTVTAAYERLVADGWLTARVGAGTWVATRMAAGVESAGRTTSAVRLSAFARRLLARVDMRRIPGATPEHLRLAFQYGAPYTNHALLGSWGKAMRKAVSYTAPGYNRSQGLPELRVQVAEYLRRRRGVQASADDVVIVGGSQQALALCARVLLDPGDPAMIEEPHYFPVRAILHAYGANVTASDVDDDGIRLDDLERVAPRAVFLTPNHQFPLGSVLGQERRRTLLRYAAAREAWLVEDDYDGEFRFGGSPLPTLHSADPHGRVIHVGTFSNSLFPGLRLGYMVVPRGLREAFVAAKYAEDLGASVIDQAAMAHFMADGSFERHLVRSGRELGRRREALIGGIRDFGLPLRIRDSRAGMHFVLGSPEWTAGDVEDIIARARDSGLGLFSTAPYHSRPPREHSLLMGYAATSIAEIDHGLAILHHVLEAQLVRPARLRAG